MRNCGGALQLVEVDSLIKDIIFLKVCITEQVSNLVRRLNFILILAVNIMMAEGKNVGCKDERELHDEPEPEPDADLIFNKTEYDNDEVRESNASSTDSIEEQRLILSPSSVTLSMRDGSNKKNSSLDDIPSNFKGLKRLANESGCFDNEMNLLESQSDEDSLVPSAEQSSKKKSASSFTLSMYDDSPFHDNPVIETFSYVSALEVERQEQEQMEHRLVELETERENLLKLIHDLEALKVAFNKTISRVLFQ